jgi:hypothetical protein
MGECDVKRHFDEVSLLALAPSPALYWAGMFTPLPATADGEAGQSRTSGICALAFFCNSVLACFHSQSRWAKQKARTYANGRNGMP